MKEGRRYEMNYSGLSGETEQNTHRCNRDIRTSLVVRWLRPDLSFQCRGHRFNSFSGNLQAEWCGRKKKKRDLYALASEVMEDEKFHDLPCRLQAGIIQSVPDQKPKN